MMHRVAVVIAVAALSACANGSREAASNTRSGTLDTALAPAERTPDVIFVPTKMPVVQQMLTLAKVDSDDLVYDLGSGDGRIVITAASQRGARGLGVDIDPQRIRESRINADSANVVGRVEFRQDDLFKMDLRPATVITLYLLPSLNVKLRPKLFAELRPGTPVVSNSFDMGDWLADSSVIVDERHVYLWIIPANASGEWQLYQGDGTAAPRAQLKLTQVYQKLIGTTLTGARSDTLRDARVRGDSIYFTVDVNGAPVEYAGTISGATMSGTTRGGNSVPWRATRSGPAGSMLPD